MIELIVSRIPRRNKYQTFTVYFSSFYKYIIKIYKHYQQKSCKGKKITKCEPLYSRASSNKS